MRISILRSCSSAVAFAAALSACAGDGPSDVVEPSIAVAITMVSGNSQEGKAGEALREPFLVRVTDARGGGVRGIAVVWNVTSGEGFVCFDTPDQCHLSGYPVITDANGEARVWFQPMRLATSTVAAGVSRLQGSPVTFAAYATGVVIRFGHVIDCGDERTAFLGPGGSSDVIVPVGATVEWNPKWLYGRCTARIVSTSVPPGGEPFDSGILRPGEYFQFVPGVAGIWEYGDAINGGNGTLTATAP